MKWKFLVISENYDVHGTNDPELANKVAEFEMVINVETGYEIGIDPFRENESEPIQEYASEEADDSN